MFAYEGDQKSNFLPEKWITVDFWGQKVDQSR